MTVLKIHFPFFFWHLVSHLLQTHNATTCTVMHLKRMTQEGWIYCNSLAHNADIYCTYQYTKMI